LLHAVGLGRDEKNKEQDKTHKLHASCLASQLAHVIAIVVVVDETHAVFLLAFLELILKHLDELSVLFESSIRVHLDEHVISELELVTLRDIIRLDADVEIHDRIAELTLESIKNILIVEEEDDLSCVLHDVLSFLKLASLLAFK
jgi:hypothetical protein